MTPDDLLDEIDRIVRHYGNDDGLPNYDAARAELRAAVLRYAAQPNEVYVVMGEHPNLDANETWPVASHIDKAEAERHAAALNASRERVPPTEYRVVTYPIYATMEQYAAPPEPLPPLTPDGVPVPKGEA